MKLLDAIRLAFQNLWRTKFRSILTILGVVIGISAIVSFVSLGVGLQKITAEQVAGLNALTTLTVSQIQATSTMEDGPKIDSKTIDEIKKIKGVAAVTPSVSIPANVSSIGTSSGAIVYGIDISNINLEVSGIVAGGLVQKDKDEVVISSALASAFSGNKEDLLGKDLEIKVIKEDAEANLQPKTVNFKIVGIDSNETTNIVYAPLGKIYSLGTFDGYSSLKVKVNSRKDIDQVKDTVKGRGYQVTTIKDLIDQIDKIFVLVQIILGLIGGIGLLVSSLGIINTMTISLLERTREIGIMKATGASAKDIRKLFLLESALIGFFGGLSGVAVAVFLGKLSNLCLNFLIRSSGQHLDLFITPVNFAFAMIALAVLIAMFAGVYPTSRAQKLLPIDALRQ